MADIGMAVAGAAAAARGVGCAWLRTSRLRSTTRAASSIDVTPSTIRRAASSAIERKPCARGLQQLLLRLATGDQFVDLVVAAQDLEDRHPALEALVLALRAALGAVERRGPVGRQPEQHPGLEVGVIRNLAVVAQPANQTLGDDADKTAGHRCRTAGRGRAAARMAPIAEFACSVENTR